MKLRFSFVMKSQIEVVLSGAQYVGKGGQNKWRVVCVCVCVCVCVRVHVGKKGVCWKPFRKFTTKV